MAEKNFLEVISDDRQFWFRIFAPIVVLYFVVTLVIVEGVFGAEIDCKRDIGLWIEELEKNPQNHREAISNIQAKANECRIDLEKEFQFSFQKLMILRKKGASINVANFIQGLRSNPPDEEKAMLVDLLIEEMKVSGLRLSDLFDELSLRQARYSIQKALKGYKFTSPQEQLEAYKLIF